MKSAEKLIAHKKVIIGFKGLKTELMPKADFIIKDYDGGSNEVKSSQQITTSCQPRSPPYIDGRKLINNKQSKFFNLFIPSLLLTSAFSLNFEATLSFLISPLGAFLISLVIGAIILPRLLLLSEETQDPILLISGLLSFSILLITFIGVLSSEMPPMLSLLTGIILGLGIGMYLLFIIWRYRFPLSFYVWKSRSKSRYARQDAAEALGNLGPSLGNDPIVEEKIVPVLIKFLEDRDSDVRVEAARSLSEIISSLKDTLILKEKIVPALINFLKNKDPWIREFAIRNLGELGDLAKDAIPLLIDSLEDKDGRVYEQAARALGQLGFSLKDSSIVKEKIVPALIKTLEKSPHKRLVSIKALDNIGFLLGDDPILNEKIVPALLEVLRGYGYTGYDVEFIEEALGKLRLLPKDVLADLIKSLEDNDSRIRRFAWNVLSKRNVLTSELKMTKYLADLKDDAESGYITAIQIQKLSSSLKDIPVSKEKIISILIGFLGDERNYIRKEIAIGLGEIGDIGVVQPLINLLEDSYSDVRETAASVLEKIGWRPTNDIEKVHYLRAKQEWDELVKLGQPAVEPLIDILSHYKDRVVEKELVLVLVELGDKRAVEPLIEKLNDSDSFIRRLATEALSNLGDNKSIAPIEGRLKRTSEILRETPRMISETVVVDDRSGWDYVEEWNYVENPEIRNLEEEIEACKKALDKLRKSSENKFSKAKIEPEDKETDGGIASEKLIAHKIESQES